ncbi:MAG TPA: hypothetical protein DCP38_12620 [Acidobacteria bacterium]|nr:hypothetical protein [Acidobacteriota bacterium]
MKSGARSSPRASRRNHLTSETIDPDYDGGAEEVPEASAWGEAPTSLVHHLVVGVLEVRDVERADRFDRGDDDMRVAESIGLFAEPLACGA